MRRTRNHNKHVISNDLIPLVSHSPSALYDDPSEKKDAKPKGLRWLFRGVKNKPRSEAPQAAAEVPTATTITITSNVPDENDAAKELESPPLSEACEEFNGPVDADTLLPEISPNDQKQSKTKLILSRPFGRAGLPPKVARNWVVEVSPAEWDADEYLWKYRILVQKRTLQSTEGCSSFTTAFTWRSLRDFIWLEEALRAEYHGGLLLPLLSVAIGTADLKNTQYEVEASILRDWLGDVLNGIRGQGEVVLIRQTVDLIRSEAMEAFLYRNTDPLTQPARMDVSNKSHLPITSILDFPWKDSPIKEVKDESFVASLWNKPFSCFPIDDMCTGPESVHSPTTPQLPLGMMSCSSRALGDVATLELQDSFVQYEPHDSSPLATHSELLEAERSLVAAYRKSSMAAMDKVRSLTEEEGQIGAAWKRFAISLSNLYSYEKEVENSKVGEINKANGGLPYRKLSKQSVDELLRLMAKQKIERSTPGLRALDGMLSAYVADLSAVPPALNAYSEAVAHLSHLDDAPEKTRKKQKNAETTWSESFRALASIKLIELKKSVSSFSNSASTAPSSTLEVENAQSQRKAFERRVFANERMLRDSLTSMCRATHVRSARMAFQYFTMEAAQAALLNSAALLLRAKISIADPKSISKLKHRHVLENKEDDKKELMLVQNIVNIGYNSKFNSAGDNGLGFDYNTISDEEYSKNLLREKAIQLASERPGKWNATLALSIMEAVGIDDAEVQVEETTRDLRLVRHHAIGLRENISRCVEAVNMLRILIFNGDPERGPGFAGVPHPILNTRHQCVIQIGESFSGTVTPHSDGTNRAATTSMSILGGVRIATNDPAGWVSSKAHGGRCKELAMTYVESRDVGLETFLNELTSLLTAYNDRLENVESFVYMQCVGIQLEKHFSKVRADSLAAFEKKTDITTAINIANRKRLPLLVSELEAKLEAVEPKVTHTTVKESKEIHLVSKNLKADIFDLAARRFVRVRETALERVVQLMTTWAKYEEKCTSLEIKAAGNVIEEVERTLKWIDVRADGVSHTFTKTKVR